MIYLKPGHLEVAGSYPVSGIIFYFCNKMIERVIQIALTSAHEARKNMGIFRNVEEFLDSTYGRVLIEPNIRLHGRLSLNPECTLQLFYTGIRNKVPIVTTNGKVRFGEVFEVARASEYSQRDSTLEEEIMFAAECRKRYINIFYKREVVILPVTANY